MEDRRRARTAALWVLAVALTLAAAYWQRVTGPTHPFRGKVKMEGRTVALELPRSHGGAGDLEVGIPATGPDVTGEVAWRRYPTSDPWNVIPLRRRGSRLVAHLPHQPPAGKIAYQVRLRSGEAVVVIPRRPVVARFKRAVPAAVLAPHILFMFLAMLLSNRAGMGALAGEEPKRTAWATIVCLVLGGFLLGPAVQKFAFDAWWTGIPWGWDLTDNKTLFMGIAWGGTAWRMARGRGARGAMVIAALVTIAVFLIPHSAWGSEIRWEEMPRGPAGAP